MAELQALNQDASAFKLRELLEATISAPQVRAVARRSGVIRGLAKLMKIETSGAGIGRASNLGPTCRRTEAVAQPPGWLAVPYNPSKTVFSSQKANDVLR
jgi:hypothetical protein